MTKKIFKAEVLMRQVLELPEAKTFGIQLPNTTLIVAKDKEDCLNILTGQIDRYREKAKDLSHPYNTKITIVIDIIIHELVQYAPAKESWNTFFRWNIGGKFLDTYDTPFLKSIYRERRNEKGEFTNLD